MKKALVGFRRLALEFRKGLDKRILGRSEARVVRVAADDKRDRQPDTNDVGHNGYDRGRDGKRAAATSRVGHHNPVHEQINGNAVQHPRNDGSHRQEGPLPAGGIKYSRGRKRDQKVQRGPERGGLPSALKGLGTKQTAGDGLQEAQRLDPSETGGDEGGRDVADPRGKAGQDGGECMGYLSRNRRRRCAQFALSNNVCNLGEFPAFAPEYVTKSNGLGFKAQKAGSRRGSGRVRSLPQKALSILHLIHVRS